MGFSLGSLKLPPEVVIFISQFSVSFLSLDFEFVDGLVFPFDFVFGLGHFFGLTFANGYKRFL